MLNDLLMPLEVKNFIEKNSIPITEILEKIKQILLLEPKAKISYDISTYSNYGVLRVCTNYRNYVIQPLLFGSVKNLTALSDNLWEKSSVVWRESMDDCSTYGAFKKKYILNSEIVKLLYKHYKEGDTILDVGCGEGSLDISIYKEITSKIYGVDISTESINIIKSLLPEISSHFSTGDVTDLKNVINTKFDFVIASMLLSNIIDTDDTLVKLKSLLKPGGLLLLCDVNPVTYHALGYEYKNSIRILHNPEKDFYSEKHICGLVKAVHHYQPWGYFRSKLENLGLTTVEEFTHTISLKTMKRLLRLHCHDIKKIRSYIARSEEVVATPPFYYLIMKNSI